MSLPHKQELNNNSQQYKKLLEKLNIYGFQINEDHIIKSISLNESFNPNCKYENDIYEVLIKIVQSILDEVYHIKKYKYIIPSLSSQSTQQQLQSYIMTSFYYLGNSKLFIVFPDITLPCGIVNKASLYYKGIIEGSILSIIPSISKENYSLILLNPNKKKNKSIDLNIDYYSHCAYVFSEFINKKYDLIKEIIVLGYGFAGMNIIKLINNNVYMSGLLNKTKRIILINSSHNDYYLTLSSENQKIWNHIAVNYCYSDLPTGHIVKNSVCNGCINRSLGSYDDMKIYDGINKEIVHYMKIDI